jgi:hypothetical protein
LSVQYVRTATITCNIARMDGVNDDEGEMVILNELIFDGIRGAHVLRGGVSLSTLTAGACLLLLSLSSRFQLKNSKLTDRGAQMSTLWHVVPYIERSSTKARCPSFLAAEAYPPKPTPLRCADHLKPAAGAAPPHCAKITLATCGPAAGPAREPASSSATRRGDPSARAASMPRRSLWWGCSEIQATARWARRCSHDPPQ